MKKSIIYLALSFAVAFTSCKGFLDEYSQNNSYVETVEDLDDMLVGGGYIQKTEAALLHLHIMSDEMREASIANIANAGSFATNSGYGTYRGFWSWAVDPYMPPVGVVSTKEDTDWPAFYKRISYVNNILSEAESFTDSKDARKLARVKGEAYFLRAWNYFMLTNLYGAPYDKSNPDDGAAVSIKLTPEVVFDKFSRAGNRDVYRQIVSDLTAAIGNFDRGEVLADNKFRANAAAAWALLSRVYLYMEEYGLAVEAADNVEGYTLFDLVNDYTPGSGKAFLTTASPEQIFAQGAYGITGQMSSLQGPTFVSILDRGQTIQIARAETYAMADGVKALFDKYGNDDIRKSAFFALSCSMYKTATSPIVFICRKTGSGANGSEMDPITGTNPYTADTGGGESFGETLSIRYAEVVLNKAEALACDNKLGLATAEIERLLEARYVTPPVVPAAQDELIAFIREERQKELCMEGHRWFDLRRYAVNSVAPMTTEIVHEYYTVVNNSNTQRPLEGKYTLAPWSQTSRGNWVVPVPAEVIDYNFPNISNFDRTAGVTQEIYLVE